VRLVLPILVIATSLLLARPTTTSPSCSPTASQINCWFRAACEPDFLAGMFSARAIVIDAQENCEAHHRREVREMHLGNNTIHRV